MALRTTAIEIAQERGMSLLDLAEASGLSLRTIYYLRDMERQPGPIVIERLMQVFPDLRFEQLFVPTNSTKHANRSARVQKPAVVAA